MMPTGKISRTIISILLFSRQKGVRKAEGAGKNAIWSSHVSRKGEHRVRITVFRLSISSSRSPVREARVCDYTITRISNSKWDTIQLTARPYQACIFDTGGSGIGQLETRHTIKKWEGHCLERGAKVNASGGTSATFLFFSITGQRGKRVVWEMKRRRLVFRTINSIWYFPAKGISGQPSEVSPRRSGQSGIVSSESCPEATEYS